MLYVKIMSGQDMPDVDHYKHYIIVPVDNNEVMRFCENEDWDKAMPPFPRFCLKVHAPEGGVCEYALTGNAYVMSESGKTIASHGC